MPRSLCALYGALAACSLAACATAPTSKSPHSIVAIIQCGELAAVVVTDSTDTVKVFGDVAPDALNAAMKKLPDKSAGVLTLPCPNPKQST